MDVLTSSEFRRRYASLKEVTQVTVNGHVIGYWRPIGADGLAGDPLAGLNRADIKVLARSRWGSDEQREEILRTVPGGSRGFAPEFRPAPKPTRKTR